MTRTKSQNGRRSRAKGASWERDLATILRSVYPKAERCIAQSRTAKREGCDVEGTPFWIESKVGARPDILGAVRQAQADTDGRSVLVVTKQDRGVPLATLPLAELMKLLVKAGFSRFAPLPAAVVRVNPDPTEPFEVRDARR